MIEIHSLDFAYPHKGALFERFSWSAAAGDTWAILGPSGCGKSTLLYLLAGLRLPTSGNIRIAGQPLLHPRPQTGLILQDFGLLPWETVSENIRLGLRIRRFYGPDGVHAPSNETTAEIEEQAAYWIETLGLKDVAQNFPGQLSGGQRQRTAIARTLALNPDLLLMDEPFASLDAPTRESLQRFVMQMQQEKGQTMVIVTHSVEEAALIGKKILLLQKPPFSEGIIFENHGAGNFSHLNSSAYIEICKSLRHGLGTAV